MTRQDQIEALCNEWGADEVLRRVAEVIDDKAGPMEYHAGSRVSGIAWRLSKLADEVMRDTALQNA